MKLWTGLAWRTAIGSVLLGLLATLATGYLAFIRGAEVALGHSARLLTGPMLEVHGAECRSAGEGWTKALADGLSLRAFDARRALAAPGEASLDPALLARLRAGETQPVAFYFPLVAGGPRFGGAMLVRVAERGPCSLLEYRWPILQPRGTRARWLLVAAITFTSLAAALSTACVVGPLLRRLRRLHRSAGALGSAAYAASGEQTPDELGDLARVLDVTHARVQADAARIADQKQALERFLSDVAHDLKTPIASLQLSLELATSSAPEELPSLLVQGIEDTVYLTSLVDNLRLACQLGEGVDPLDGNPRAELGMLVARVVRRLGLLARRKSLAVDAAHPDAAIWVRCHPTMLEQAVGNLVHNAITHGTPGGHVVAVLEEAGPEHFRLTVLDDGPGLSAEELQRLGQRRFRSDEARRRDPRGSGLGVAIVRELCQRAGLSLSFSPNPPHGLKVIIEGPRAPPPVEPLPGTAPPH